jgi:predicted dehydrogenase
MNEVKRRIDAGQIGELNYVETHFGFSVPFMPEHRLFKAELGGGTVLDQGIYTNTIARWIAGSPAKTISARGELYDNGTESLAFADIRFENGVWGYTASGLKSALGTNARFSGTGGYVDILGSFWSPDTAVFYKPNSTFGMDEERVDLPKTGAGYSHMIKAVSQAVLDGKTETEEHPLDFTIEMMGVLDEIRRQLGSMK